MKATLDEMGWSGWLVIERSRDARDVHNVKANFGANTRYVKAIFQEGPAAAHIEVTPNGPLSIADAHHGRTGGWIDIRGRPLLNEAAADDRRVRRWTTRPRILCTRAASKT